MERLWDINCMIGRWPTSEFDVHDLPGLLAHMDRLGIERAVVSHSHAWQYDPAAGNARLMDELSRLEAGQRARLEPCWAVVPPATGELGTPAELAAALADHGVRVVRLFPRDHNYSLSAPDAAELLSLLAERRTVALVDLDQTSCEEIERVAAAHPALPLVVCRPGYRVLRRLAGVLARRPNCFLDLSYFGSHQGVEWLVERFGAGRLLFGTGAPLVDAGGAVTRVMLAGVAPADRAAIAWRNLEALLGARDNLQMTAAGDSPAAQARRGDPITGIDLVDAHGHVGPWFNFFTPQTDAETLISVMDRCGVRMTVISSLLGVGPDAIAGNAEVRAILRRYPDRFAAYAVFNPHHSDSAADVEARLGEPGFVGIKIHPDTHAYSVESPLYEPAWALAARFGVPVLTHTYEGSPYCDPRQFDYVATHWPETKIILGHAGVTEEGCRRAIAVARKHPNLYLELCGSLMTGQWIRKLVAAVGPERVLFGTDFPFIDLRYGLGRVLFAGLQPAELERVIGGNARTLLKLSEQN